MSNKRRGLLYLAGAAGGSLAITSTPGAIGVGSAPNTIILVKKVVSTTAATGVGSAAGVALRSRAVATFPATGIGTSTGTERIFINLTASFALNARGQGTASGSLAMFVNIASTVATTGKGSAAGSIARTRVINAAGILAGLKGSGTATGLLYPIKNLTDEIVAGGPFKGQGTSTGAIRRLVAIAAVATGTGNSGAATTLSRTKPVVPTTVSGQGLATGAIRRTIRVVAAGIGIGTSVGVATVAGSKQILAASIIAPTGIGSSTGAIRRTLKIVAAAVGIGSSVGAVVKYVEKRLLAGNLVAPTGIGSAVGAVIRIVGINTEVPTGIAGNGTAATVVTGTGLRIFVRISSTPVTTGIGTSTGAIRRTIPLAAVMTAPKGIGYSVGSITKGGLKQILATTTTTGIGTSAATSTALRFKRQLPNANGVGIGYSTISGLGISGSVTIWSAAYDTEYITQFDPSWWHPSTVHTYTALFKLTSGSSVKTRLYNVTDAAPVAGSELTLSGTAALTEMESGALTFPSGVKNYRAEVGKVGGSMGNIKRARIASQGS